MAVPLTSKLFKVFLSFGSADPVEPKEWTLFLFGSLGPHLFPDREDSTSVGPDVPMSTAVGNQRLVRRVIQEN
jgi:hypothetical protein